MTRDFSEVMSQHTDRQLAEILTTKRHEYQEAAIKAAQDEFEKRALDVNNFVTVEEMRIAEEGLVPIPNEAHNLSLIFKILTLLLPIPVSIIWGLFCSFVLELPVFRGFVTILIILTQFAIWWKLKDNGYTTMSAEFKLWTLNSWILFVSLSIVVFVLEYVLTHQ